MRIVVILEPPQNASEDKFSASYVTTVNGTAKSGEVYARTDRLAMLALVKKMVADFVISDN